MKISFLLLFQIQFDGKIFIQDVAHEDDYNQFKSAEVKKDEGCYFTNNKTAKSKELLTIAIYDGWIV